MQSVGIIPFFYYTAYKVETGRRDGLSSLARNVDLPSPSIPVLNAIAAFEKKGLTTLDMVLLLGIHIKS